METINFGQKLIAEHLFDPQWQRRYADSKSLLMMLKECGISFVEIFANEQTSDSSLLTIAEQCAEIDLFISLNYSFAQQNTSRMSYEYIKELIEKKLKLLQQISNITGTPVSYVMAGVGFGVDSVFNLFNTLSHNEQTLFQWLEQVTTEKYDSVVPLCETLPPAGDSLDLQINVADTWEGCLQVIGQTSLGICWDFGNSYLSYIAGKQELFPGEHFLARVTHVYAHDIRQTETGILEQQPLSNGVVPWREYCALLARHEFTGTVLLKIDPGIYDDLEAFLQNTADQVRKLEVFF